MRKKAIIQAVNNLPDNVKLDEVFEQLLVIEKIEAGLIDLKEGKTMTHELVKKKAKKWSK